MVEKLVHLKFFSLLIFIFRFSLVISSCLRLSVKRTKIELNEVLKKFILSTIRQVYGEGDSINSTV
jgi:hypothetical protein